MITLRVLLRRSTEEHQEYSLDTQREGCLAFADQLRHRAPPVDWKAIREYLDDGIAGDDFLGRAGLRQLMDDLQPGDAVVCRDHSRLGRDALEVTLVVRELVRRRGGRLFYYSSGQEVTFNGAIDAATTFIQGVGAQMELENIRSRTREALRARVRQGRVAGGRCFGYSNVRMQDPSGRSFTIAVINPGEAAVVREIFERFLAGYGLKRIADHLNRRGLPSPFAGRRGTGTWSPGCLHEMLRRERYRGVYVHGQVDRIKHGGKRVARDAATTSVLRVEIPEWRIIDEPMWLAVQEALARRRRIHLRLGPATKYPLTSIARCAGCGGRISSARTTRDGVRVAAYACNYHHERGSAVCPVPVHQPIDEVDAPLLEYVREAVVPEHRLADFIRDVRERVAAAQESCAEADVTRLRAELARVRAEQRRYAAAISSAPRVQEVVAELNRRSARVAMLRGEIAAASCGSADRRASLARVDELVVARLNSMLESVGHTHDGTARALYSAIFGKNLLLRPSEKRVPTVAHRRHTGRRVWCIELRDQEG